MHQSPGLRCAARHSRQAHGREASLRFTKQSFEEIFSDFATRRRMEFGGHTDPSWRGRHETSAAFIVPVEGSSLRSRLGPIQEALDDFDFVALHPDDFMHLTLALIGFLGEDPDSSDGETVVSKARLDEIRTHACDALAGFGEFTFRLENLNAFPGVAFIEVHESDGLRALTKTLKAACELKHVVWPPHLTVAYFHLPDGTAAPDELVSTIEKFREWPVGEVSVREVELSLLDLDRDYPAIETFDRIAL